MLRRVEVNAANWGSFLWSLESKTCNKRKEFPPWRKTWFTWKSLLLGYSNNPRSKLRPGIQGADLKMAPGQHEVHVYSAGKEETAFKSSKYLCHGYIKVMLTATHSCNESNLQFITGNLNRCLKQEQRDCHVGARAFQPPPQSPEMSNKCWAKDRINNLTATKGQWKFCISQCRQWVPHSARRCGVAQQDQTHTCGALFNARERPLRSAGT